jgi:hypothetical protein
VKGLSFVFVFLVGTAFAYGAIVERVDYSSLGRTPLAGVEAALGGHTRTFVTEGWYVTQSPEKCSGSFLGKLIDGYLLKLDQKKVYFGFIASCFKEPSDKAIPFLLNLAVQALKPADEIAVLEFIRSAEAQPAYGNPVRFTEARRILSRVFVGAGVWKGQSYTEARADVVEMSFPSLIDFDDFMNQAQKTAFSATEPEKFVDFMTNYFSPKIFAAEFATDYLKNTMPKVNYIRGYNSPTNTTMPFPAGTFILKGGGTAMAVGWQPFTLVRDCRKSPTGFCG